MSKRTLRLWRGGEDGAHVDYEVEAETGMVVLDAVLEIQRHQAKDLAVRWNCKAAKCGSCSAEVNGMPCLMCKTRLDHLPGVSARPRPRHGRLMELRGELADSAIHPGPGRGLVDWPG
jgi:succinate dehydrogenase / fumarate reductase iron-sulfur subunit